MKILDLRRWDSRQVERLWRSWDRQITPASRFLSRITEPITQLMLQRRLAGRGLPPARPLIVSVGNLRVGGTGKTPVVIALAKRLADRGVTGAILTRGYGSRQTGPVVVESGDSCCGDEARLMAAAVVDRNWSVVQARQRSAGLVTALGASPQPQVIVVEDGHQTAGVPRHLDVLILDRWQLSNRDERSVVHPECGLVLPWGPYREPSRGAERAAVWLVDVSDQDAGWPAEPVTGADTESQVLGFQRRMLWPDTLSPTGRTDSPLPAPDSDQRWAVLSGIARPGGFEAGCSRLLGHRPEMTVRCDDHCSYRLGLLERILTVGQEAGATAWLTTTKDHIKLRSRWPSEIPLVPIRLELNWAQKQTLDELVVEHLESL